MITRIDYTGYTDFDAYIKDDMRYYITPDGDFASVTSILGATGDNHWLQVWKDKVGEEEANRIRDEAAVRGTAVHDYMEKYYDNNNHATDYKTFAEETGLDKEPKNIKSLVYQLYKGTKKHNMKVLFPEIALYHPELKYCGRADVIGYWDGELVVLDYKTSKKKKTLAWIKDYQLQSTMYCMAHNYLYGTNIQKFVVIIAVDGQKECQIFEGNPIHYENEVKFRLNQFYK